MVTTSLAPFNIAYNLKLNFPPVFQEPLSAVRSIQKALSQEGFMACLQKIADALEAATDCRRKVSNLGVADLPEGWPPTSSHLLPSSIVVINFGLGRETNYLGQMGFSLNQCALLLVTNRTLPQLPKARLPFRGLDSLWQPENWLNHYTLAEINKPSFCDRR